MNDENLIPFNELTEKEARILSRRGGIASGKSRRASKTLAQRIKLALTISTNENLRDCKVRIRELWPNRSLPDNKKQLRIVLAQSRTIRDCGIDVYNVLKVAQAPETQEIALKAANILWDREEGKPNQTLDVSTEDKRQFSSIKLVDGEKVVELK